MAHVYFITLLSRTHLDRGRFVLSIDAVNKDNVRSLIDKREKEKQMYVEDDDMSGGGCSPEVELHLSDGRCKIQLSISGALKPSAKLEKGEDILEFNENQGECRKLLSLVPCFDDSGDDTGTIKFKVGDEIKHTVHIHEIRTKKNQDFNQSGTSISSNVSNTSLQSSSSDSIGLYSSLPQNADEGQVVDGTVLETRTYASGSVRSSTRLQADPVPPELNDAVGGMRLQDDGPTVVPPEETPYDKMLLEDSLYALARSLPPNDASMLLTELRVPTSIQEQSRFDNSTSIVAANFTSLKHWKAKKTTRPDTPEVTNQQLFEDLIQRLENIGRKDIVSVMKKKLAANKKIEHSDFSAL